jgi:hypothetical protein
MFRHFLFFSSIQDDQILSAMSTEMNEGEESYSRDYQWHEKYRIRLFHVHIVSVSDKSCKLKLGVGGKTKVRAFSFQSKQDKENFLNVARAMKALEKERADRLAAAYRVKLRQRNTPDEVTDEKKEQDSCRKSNQVEPLPKRKVTFRSKFLSPTRRQGKKSVAESKLLWDGREKGVLADHPLHDEGDNDSNDDSLTGANENKPSKSRVSKGLTKLGRLMLGPSGVQSLREDVDAEVTIDLLIEIVSAGNLPAANFSKSDPYVRVFDGRTAVHRTKHVPKTYVIRCIALANMFCLEGDSSNNLCRFLAG